MKNNNNKRQIRCSVCLVLAQASNEVERLAIQKQRLREDIALIVYMEFFIQVEKSP